MRGVCAAVVMAMSLAGVAQQSAGVSPTVAKYIKVPAAEYILLEHVRVIDGTGAAAREAQMVMLHNGKIESVRAGLGGRS